MRHPAGSRVGIGKLKAHLSEILRKVRSGHSVTVLDRQTPIALLIPVQEGNGILRVRKPTRDVKSIKLPLPLRLRVDSLAILLEDRRKR